MALQSSFSRFGFTFTGAYHRVSQYVGDKVITTFTVTTYASQEARVNSAEPINERTFQCTYAPDVLTACYDFLKEQGSYTDALDI
jgi:hypothetical protein